jgi:uncharacterized protein YcbK (DUF882 family)
MAGNFLRDRISDFILYREVRCPCGCMDRISDFWMVDPGVVAIFHAWRLLLGHPLKITSFVRCRVHNAKIGGAPDSLHLCGAAIDFVDEKSEITSAYLDRLNKVVGAGGLGIYPDDGHFHVDCGHLLGLKPYRRWRGREL